ncbi:interferon-induced very large GTPase 1-like isoform X1 [Osmerus eperlanus]|uniref:interferon-induced very large GTPase 1-like isoform X1 n=1 Tax=Osmerus eperlanus TaxID=29151 RepID=UPI002E0D9222
MEEATGSPQEEAISQLKRVYVEEAELPSASNMPRNKEHQLMEYRVSLEEAELPSAREEDRSRHGGDRTMEPRVEEERPVSPSYLSMKSDQSMDVPIHFKMGDTTQEGTQICKVHPARSESPTPSYSAMSDSSVERSINFNDGGLPKIKPEDILCDLCFDVLEIEKRAVKTCQTCNSSFCEKHIRKHYTDARFQTHQLVDVPGGLEHCQDHLKPLEVFCLTDQRFICSQCSVTKHKGHDIHHQTQQAGAKRSAGVGAQRPRCVNAMLPPPGEISFLSVKPDSVTLSWGPPEGLEGRRKFRVTWEGDGEKNSLSVTDFYRVVITGLQPGQKYEFTVATEGDHGNHSNLVSKSTYTVVPPPKNIKVDRFGPYSFKVCWSRYPGMDHVPQRFLVCYTGEGEELVAMHAQDCCTTLTDLQPGTQYTVKVCTVWYNNEESEPVNTTICTSVPAPGKLTVVSVGTTSATVSWEHPDGMEQTQLQYQVSWQSPGTRDNSDNKTIEIGCSTKLNGLQPATQYTVSVSTMFKTGEKSEPVHTTFNTDIEPPRCITVNSSTTTSVSLSWQPPDDMEEKQRYRVEWKSGGHYDHHIVHESSYNITNLKPGRAYAIKVATVGDNEKLSKFVETTSNTEPTPPENLHLKKVKNTSVTLCWDTPVNMEDLSYSFKYSCNRENIEHITKNNSAVLSDLEPGTSYTFKVATVLENGCTSLRETIDHSTNKSFKCLLDNLGLGHCWTNKLTVEMVRQIDENSMSEKADLPSQLQLFLKRLLMVNIKAMNLKQDAYQHSLPDHKPSSDEEMPDGLKDINPLDVITALFLCSDGILQQELSLKLSLCQFAVPLLLPNPETQQCTLMLWAMRDIVKQFIPHPPGDSKEYVEKSIVETELPMVSFVRFGDSSLSKSKVLNDLSNSQQTHNTFVHRNMRAGNIPKTISDGLVEISWYLPSGIPNIDVFPEPVAVANLRGDIEDFPTQFKFLCETSAAMFVFCDDLDVKCIPDLSQLKLQLFIVCDFQSGLKKEAAEFQKYNVEIIEKRKNMNEAELVDKICSEVKKVLKSDHLKIKVESMVDVASQLSIPVDEKCSPCDTAKDRAARVTENIKLPLQGTTWKELTRLEKEQCILKLAGDEKHESDKTEQRREQVTIGMSDSVKWFIEGLKSPEDERSYFLKWMKIILDNISRAKHSKLMKRDQRQAFPEGHPDTNMKELVDRSLGTEHFLREVGQLYEASMCVPETTDLKHQLQELPTICAELMLAGFPLELMDGDVSNIPMRWVTDVLKELDSLIQLNNKIRVVTILGSQSSGKSTLLNTMFGVQFAVSSGRCTRGAFMQLIKVKHEFRDVIKCDFLMIIDTEGLKAAQLLDLTDNYKHDNELATFVVGLSDISIVNIAMENHSDVRDLLQIVAHAFLRMSQKESGKKPSCLFVHQNVPDISAPHKNRRDQKLLLEQLNEMTSVASRMEHLGKDLVFTDIINYRAEDTCYLPGLWYGSPPMAPVNQGYSEGVAKVKSYLIQTFSNKTEAAETLLDFSKSVKDLWDAVKCENFLFNFRNSLVAEAYSKLSAEFSSWEWDFQKPISIWLLEAETRVANYGLIDSQEENLLDKFAEELRTEANLQLKRHGNIFVNKVAEYYKTGANLQLVEKYKNEFHIDTESRKRRMAKTVERRLEVAVDVRKCTFGVDRITKNNKTIMEKNVSELVKCCRGKQKMTVEQIKQEFEKMWTETSEQLSFKGHETQNVPALITTDLHVNLTREGPKVQEMLNKSKPLENCGKDAFKVNRAHIIKKLFNKNFSKSTFETEKVQDMANDTINQCLTFVAGKVKEKTDYHPAHTMELLELIENNLKKHCELDISPKIAAALKIHICGHAAREFQSMHEAFIKDKDPERNFLALKPQYCNDFKGLYYQKETRKEYKRKAKEFTDESLKPAVMEYIQKSPNLDINGIIKEIVEFRTIRHFQLFMLKELSSSEFNRFQEYIKNYNESAQNLIQQILETRCRSNKIEIVRTICREIQAAVVQLEGTHISNGGDIKEFFVGLRSKLNERLVISDNTTGLVVNNFRASEFSNVLTELIGKMEKDLLLKEKSVPCGPLKQQQKKLLGCQRFCPRCNVPCDKEGESHWWHTALTHRPLAFGKEEKSGKLTFQMCSHTDSSWFTIWKSYFKREVQPYDTPITATPYWKFIFAKHNEKYAEIHKCSPGKIPEAWKAITREEAVQSLKI